MRYYTKVFDDVKEYSREALVLTITRNDFMQSREHMGKTLHICSRLCNTMIRNGEREALLSGKTRWEINTPRTTIVFELDDVDVRVYEAFEKYVDALAQAGYERN